MRALARDVAASGAKVVRTVLKPDDHLIIPWITACRSRDIKVLGVLARESGDFNQYIHLPLDYWQIGNETDNPDGEASWYQTHDEINDLIRAVRLALPHAYLIGPGLVTGAPAWLNGLDLTVLDAIAAHFYGDILIDVYKDAAPHLDLWVTEFPWAETAYDIASHPSVKGACHFCWSNVMHPDYGLIERPEAYSVFKQATYKLMEGKMAGLNVGQGLWDYVLSKGDQANRDSRFTTNQNGTTLEEVWGSLGYYYCSNATGSDGELGDLEYYGPFGGQ